MNMQTPYALNIKPVHQHFRMPTKGSDGAGAYDLYMPVAGTVHFGEDTAVKVPLGFAAEIPPGHVAMLFPRSGIGAKQGLELNNTCGIIDSDYRGEWFAFLRVKNTEKVCWERGDRLLQMLIVPVAPVVLNQVSELADTSRNAGGFGSTGK